MTHSTLQIPSPLPFMRLPNAVLFPDSMLPLYIFEEKYRSMLAECLGSHRMFGIVLVPNDATSEAPFGNSQLQVAGAGLIRACVSSPDGSSNLILQGLARVRLVEFLPGKPYPLASLEVLNDQIDDPGEVERLALRLEARCRRMREVWKEFPKQLRPLLDVPTSPSRLCDILAASMVREPASRQRLLETLSLANRLELLHQQLDQLNWME